MNRHAYLIMAHDDQSLLETLLQLLDEPYNDIYLHIDIKSTMVPEFFTSCISQATLFLVERKDVKWGHFSLAACEMQLLREAIKVEHSYYHLLSGHDLPIRPQREIYEFFEQNAGVEYIAFNRPTISKNAKEGVTTYRGIFEHQRIEHFFQKIQNVLKVDRSKKYKMTYMKGSNWFSITHELATYVVEKEKLIEKMFRFTRNSDEIFLQTIVFNSPFRNRLKTDYHDIEYRTLNAQKVMANLRIMDWPDRLGTAHPRILTIDDLETLQASGAFWARKFDSKTDAQIIQEIYNLCK